MSRILAARRPFPCIVFNVPQLLPILHEAIVGRVVAGHSAVAAAIDEAGARGVEAVAQPHSAAGYAADGQVLAVALAVAAPERDDDELGDEEDGEGDESGNKKRLWCRDVSVREQETGLLFL